jgi:hypothetical protein
MPKRKCSPFRADCKSGARSFLAATRVRSIHDCHDDGFYSSCTAGRFTRSLSGYISLHGNGTVFGPHFPEDRADIHLGRASDKTAFILMHAFALRRSQLALKDRAPICDSCGMQPPDDSASELFFGCKRRRGDPIKAGHR